MIKRKPRFLNKPEDVTLAGTPRKRSRTFSDKEIEFLLAQEKEWKNPLNELGCIRNNFGTRFNWKPSKLTLQFFFEKKTYQWAWEKLAIPAEKPQTRQYKKYEYSDETLHQIRDILADPYYGSSEKNFLEGMHIFLPSTELRKNSFFYFRKKFGMPTIRHRSNKEIAAKIKELVFGSTFTVARQKVKEQLNLELTATMYNYHRTKQGLDGLSSAQLAKIKRLEAKEHITIRNVEVHYVDANGKFSYITIDRDRFSASTLEEFKSLVVAEEGK